jgi:hypothetical protein
MIHPFKVFYILNFPFPDFTSLFHSFWLECTRKFVWHLVIEGFTFIRIILYLLFYWSFVLVLVEFNTISYQYVPCQF